MSLTLQRLCLGTVQLGLPYGIANRTGQPSTAEAALILEHAVTAGLTLIDTAAAYGEAEERIGHFLQCRDCKQVRFISKLRPHQLASLPAAKREAKINEELTGSLQRLLLPQLYAYLLHTSDDFYLSGVTAGLQACRKAGLTQHIGVSIYEPQQALDAAQADIDFIQVPYNLFDTRLDQTDFFRLAAANGVTVHARSPFLQGLLLLPAEEVPEHLQKAVPLLQKLDAILEKYNFSRKEATFLFSYLHPGVEAVVFGTETVEQLKEDLTLAKRADEFAACREELAWNFSDVSRAIIIPSLWAIPSRGGVARSAGVGETSQHLSQEAEHTPSPKATPLSRGD